MVVWGPVRVDVRLVLGLASWCTMGCGLRTDALDDRVASGAPSAQAGTCEQPSELPTFDTQGMGNRDDEGRLEGWCQATSGGEVVYRLAPDQATDVTIAFDSSATDDGVALRDLEGVCATDPAGAFTIACETDPVSDSTHFFANRGEEYFIVVDGEGAGAFQFDVRYGNPPLDAYNPHTE